MTIKPEQVATRVVPEDVKYIEKIIDDILTNPERCTEAIKEIRNPIMHLDIMIAGGYYYEFKIAKRISWLTGNEIKRRYHAAGWPKMEISGGESESGGRQYILTVRLHPPIATPEETE